MKKIEENLDYFKKHHSDIYKAYQDYGKMLHEKGGPLDGKTRWLIKVAVSATCGYEYALRTHIKKALKNGCTVEEIEHALLLVGPTAGFPKTMHSIMILREETGAQ
ncbi:MAG: carboxymuconolactone decarboxylase family protein [Desulfobacterales bacterium]|nr:carboxymuconolactone decarboxylase family protein [Desulfobacterales bacterium]